MSPSRARLVLASDRRKVAPLDGAVPLTIGRAAANRLCLASLEAVSEHHAVVRYSSNSGWVVCDWQSRDGTYLEGQRVRRCRPLTDGDHIRLGSHGPELVFELLPEQGEPTASAPSHVAVGEQSVEVALIRSAAVHSLPRHPHLFSWWLLLCLGGLLLLPFPLLFWPLQIGALAGSLLLRSRKQHQLVLVLRDGRALRHSFANRRTALAHRNGIRKAIGQSSEAA